jgi:hypothetical protein
MAKQARSGKPSGSSDGAGQRKAAEPAAPSLPPRSGGGRLPRGEGRRPGPAGLGTAGRVDRLDQRRDARRPLTLQSGYAVRARRDPAAVDRADLVGAAQIIPLLAVDRGPQPAGLAFLMSISDAVRGLPVRLGAARRVHTRLGSPDPLVLFAIAPMRRCRRAATPRPRLTGIARIVELQRQPPARPSLDNAIVSARWPW